MRPQIYMTKLRKNWVAIIWIVIGTIYFLPCLFYASDKFGIDTVNTEKTIGAQIKFKAHWFPLASSNTLLGKLLIPSDLPQTVIYCKIDWVSPWDCDQVWVSKSKAWEIKEGSDKFATERQYSWGKVGIVKDEVAKTPGGKLGVVQGVGIGISGSNLNILDDIIKIN